MTRRQLLASLLAPEPIIDIHQHTPYTGRTDEELVRHQEVMGVTLSILLPAGRKYGLAAGAGGNDICVRLARQYPDRFKFFANEAPDVPDARQTMEKYLKLGAIGIGEQKFPLDCDGPEVRAVAELARDYKVPVLLHFEHNTYNLGFNRFYRVLEKYPTVNFIGHAQTWWGNIDASLEQEVLYPRTRVTPGGITDRYLRDYPNLFADMSAGSGLNALLRDEDHARGFLDRHQNKLLYGSDCSDRDGQGDRCSGHKQIATIRRLAPNKAAERKILYENSKRLFRL
jgi:predicted TIM-barrel fold metal-dependent hydrolase